MAADTARKKAVRPMTSTVNWVLLGLVMERPSYAFELGVRFQRIYAEVLPVSGDSHVYSALDGLRARRLVETIPGIGFGRQPKPHYRATELGVRSYEEWLVKQVDVDGKRQELWVRQLAIFADDPVAALRLIERWEREYLKDAGQIGQARPGAAADSRARLIDGLVAEQRRIAVGAMLAWLGHARERFEALEITRLPGDDAPRA